MRINKDLLVQLQYELFLPEDEMRTEEELVEATTPENPLTFILGMGLMLPAFEAELIGLEAGDTFDFHLLPEDAYGEIEDDLFISLPRETFFVDGKLDPEIVYVGAVVPMMTSDGQRVQGVVNHMDDESVLMDFNHPLAGETLHFRGTIEVVKEPTAEEFNELFAPSGCSCDHCGHNGEDDHSSCCGGHHHHEHGYN